MYVLERDKENIEGDMRVLVITAVLMLVFAIIYGATRGRIGCRSLVFKALATFMAVYLGIHGAIRFGGMTGTFMSLGLVLCMAADVALELDFVKGILLFGTAHICFIASYNRLAHPEWYTFAGAALAYLVVFVLFKNEWKHLGKLKAAAVIYMAVLCYMAASAVTLWISYRTEVSFMAAAGAVCFVISDGIIAYRTTKGKDGPIYGAAILLLYYSAVYLFGAAVFIGL